jgi:hypothetical protein
MGQGAGLRGDRNNYNDMMLKSGAAALLAPSNQRWKGRRGARSWEIVYFFPELNQSVDAVFGRLPYVRCALTTKNTGETWSSGVGMESYHWFLLGIMVALTPSLLVLGLLLARTHDQPADTQHSGE